MDFAPTDQFAKKIHLSFGHFGHSTPLTSLDFHSNAKFTLTRLMDKLGLRVVGSFRRSSGIWQGIESCDKFSPDFVRTVICFLCKCSSEPIASNA